MNKDIKKILIMLAFYSLSVGILYNFQELWMSNNELSIRTIGIVYSLCALITVSVIFICSNLLKSKYLKKFISILMFIKVLLIIVLYLLDSSGEKFWIKLLIMLDYVIDIEILISVYPLISTINKNNHIFAKKGLIYTFFYYIGAILTSVLIGRNILSKEITYNFYLILSSIFLLIAFIILQCINMNKYTINEDKNNNVMDKLIGILKHDIISKNYLLYIFTGNISFYAISSLVLTSLITNLNIAPNNASFFLLGLGILASLIGMLILSKLTLKNNYINIGIKLIGRFLTYLLVVIFCNKITILLAIIYTKIFSESYSHITDAPYINRFDNDLQLSFCNLKEMVGLLSRAIGTFICGFAISINIKIAYLIAALFVGIQVYYAYKALKLRNGDIK